MALATEKLYYRRAGVTYSINLYTATSDVGAEYITVKHANGLRYAPIVVTTDSRASFLRVQKNGVTKAIASTSISYKAWTVIAHGAGIGSTIRYTDHSRTFDYYTVNASTNVNNLMIVLTAYDPITTVGYYKIDGATYSVNLGTPKYHRLSTGNHTISVAGQLYTYGPAGDKETIEWITSAYYTVP